MAEEIQEAVQIIRVAYDGIEIAMKVGSGGIAAMQKAIDFLKGMLDYEKSLGKTSMRKLILKGGDLQVLQFNTEDMKKVEKMAKKYGILYSVLPDCNRKDGLSEVIFHTEAVPRVNMMIQKLKFGKIATFDDYLKNGDEKSLGKLMDFLKKQQGNEKSHTIEGDKVNSAIDGLIEKVGAEMLKADVLKYPHHGLQALTPEYRAAVSPELAIVTCNQRETDGKKYIRRTALDTVWTVPGFVHLMTDGEMWVCDRIVSDVKY